MKKWTSFIKGRHFYDSGFLIDLDSDEETIEQDKTYTTFSLTGVTILRGNIKKKRNRKYLHKHFTKLID